MSRGGTKWYRKEEYKQVRPPFEMGDGSICEVVPHPDKGGRWLQIQRVWPAGILQTVDLLPPENPYGETKYGFVSEGPANAEPKPSLDERLGSGTYRPPYTIMNAVPGQKPGENFHAGTGRTYDSRAEFNQYFKENNLELVGPAETSRMHLKQSASDEAGERPATFEHKNGIPVPPQFQGKKFHYAAKD